MVDITRQPLSDDELKVLVDAEIENSMGYLSGELSDERSTALDRYLGEPLGTEMEGRSQVHARDVLETIEFIMPTLIDIFLAQDRSVEFIPTGPEDEQQAEQEADYINFLFHKKQKGFLILYSWFKDALTQKNGTVKTYVEEFEKVTKEKYENLNDMEWQALMADDEIQIGDDHEEIQTAEGTMHSATLVKTEDDVRFCTEVIPPEEFLISKDANSVDPTHARFCAHVTTKTVSELREMGYTDADLSMMEIGDSEIEWSEEKLARLNLDDEQRWFDTAPLNTGMRKVRVKECYLYADRDGDGIAERLKVFRSGDFIDVEEIDYHPLNSITPVILTHKHFGLSIADLIKDIQEIRTMLFRSYMDNINQMINGTTYYDENTVNIDDMLTSKPFGVRAVDGNPNTSVFYIPPHGLPPEAFTLNELLDKFLHSRVGEFQTQLDPQVLAQANTGVVVNMLNEAKAKVKMIARIFAEVGLKPLFLNYHHLARKYSNKEDIIKLRNNWVPINPAHWRERHDMTVKVGLGNMNSQEQLTHLNGLMQAQMSLLQMGVPVVQPINIYNTMMEMTDKMGQVPEKFWTHPSKIPPPQPQPDAQMEMVKMTAQVENQKLMLENQKMQLDHQRKLQELQIKNDQMASTAQIQNDRNQLEALRAEIQRIDDLTKSEKELLAMQLKKRELDIKEDSEAANNAIELTKNETKAMLDQYKAELTAAVDLVTSQMQSQQNTERKAEAMIVDLMDSVEKMQESQSAPKEIKTDDMGRIIQIGDRKVIRDDDGKLLRTE